MRSEERSYAGAADVRREFDLPLQPEKGCDVVQAEDAARLCQFVLHLLQQYAGFNQGHMSVAAATRLRAEAAQESCRSASRQR